jgi:hypothetical protein
MQQQYTVAKETLPLRFFLVASTTCTTIERNYYCIVFFCYSLTHSHELFTICTKYKKMY